MTDLNESAQITIDAPASVIFAILSDPRQHSRIDGSGTVGTSTSGPERLELGSEFGMSMKMGAPYRIKNKVVEYEPDALIAWRHLGVHRWRYELTPTTTGGTQVVETWDLSAYGSLGRKVLHGLFGKKTAAALSKTLAKLKAAAEADAAA
ncbi:MAG: Polyketide cyclase / dehydrase and lipid transport [Marmoricola sp.]|nr:Polyketide cyclase / dehydrase and lipid transport [Marmoricola sp.]